MRPTFAPILALSFALWTTDVAAQTAGTITAVPNTCATYSLECFGTPQPGGYLSWTAGPALMAPIGYLVVGTGSLGWNGAPLPQPLGPLAPSLAGCSQLAPAGWIVPFWTTNVIAFYDPILGEFFYYASYGVDWSIPELGSLVGVQLQTQAVVLGPSGPTVSDGVVVQIGG